jgi:signal transduction histidine kinase
MLERLKKIDYGSFYPFFFTLLFILMLIQYPFHSWEAFFSNLFTKFDFVSKTNTEVVLIQLDEESDAFLHETYPYTYASHMRMLKELTKDKPLIISYILNLDEPDSDVDTVYQTEFKSVIKNYVDDGGSFRFGTQMEEVLGEILPPQELKDIGFSPAVLFVDKDFFAKDEVVRRATLNISGEDTLHLWVTNQYLQLKGQEKKDALSFRGHNYNQDNDVTYSLFRYDGNPLTGQGVEIIPFHRVSKGNFPAGYFSDKIILVGSYYQSNPYDSVLTPFASNGPKASKLAVHANIIKSLINDKTIYPVSSNVSKTIAVLLALMLAVFISKLHPTQGLLITIGAILFCFISSYLLFILFGLWVELAHILLSIFVVYYIWVPFRAIEEYQTRYAIEEEAKILKRVDHLKQNFISLMSHDLKTPVAKIAGIADILRVQYNNTADQKALLDNIILATKDLNNYITSILDLTKIESQNLTLKKESKDVNNLIESTVEKLKFEAGSKEMNFALELGPLYPIEIDVILMNRVISNIIENAIKYAGSGKTVAVTTWDDTQWVYIKVADNGAGIGASDLAHIFEKFYRVKNDSVHMIKGSGLGLYLVKYFVELHDGEISVESIIGEGTAFTIKLKNA